VHEVLLRGSSFPIELAQTRKLGTMRPSIKNCRQRITDNQCTLTDIHQSGANFDDEEGAVEVESLWTQIRPQRRP